MKYLISVRGYWVKLQVMRILWVSLISEMPFPATLKKNLVTAGASPALAVSILAFSDPGDSVLVPNPGWPTYTDILRSLGRRIHYYSMEPFLTDSQITDLAAKNPKAIILNTPHNPTGRVLSSTNIGQLEKLKQLCSEMTIISDEVYNTLVFAGQEHLSPIASAGLRKSTIVIRSFSKTYSMPDWRVGYLVADKENLERIVQFHLTIGSYPSTLAQETGCRLLSDKGDLCEILRRRYETNHNTLLNHLQKIGFFSCEPSQGTMYLFPGIPGNGRAVTEELAQHCNIHFAAGEDYGSRGKGHLRICLALQESQMDELVRRLTLYVKDLNF